MSSDPNTENVIASALALSADQRLAVVSAIHVSLADPSIDHGPEAPADAVASAWKDEIAQRIAEVDSGKVQTVPAEHAERLIRSDAKPAV